MATYTAVYAMGDLPVIAGGVSQGCATPQSNSAMVMAASDGAQQSYGFVLGIGNGGSGVGITGYPVRSGDTLLVVDATGKMVGILPG